MIQIPVKISVLIICLLFLGSWTHAHNILILNSYHNGYFWTDMLTEGIKESIKQEPNTNLFIEYLDTKRKPKYFDGAKYIKTLKSKYSQDTLDLIILTDNDALDFYFSHQEDSFFLNKPIVVTGVTDIENYPSNPQIYYVREITTFKETFDQIESLFPNTDTLFFISDKLKSGLILKQEVQSLIKKNHQQWTLAVIDSFDIHELSQLIHKIQPPSAIFVSAVSVDKNGNPLNEYDVANRIQQEASVPVFSGYYAKIMDGYIGGALTDGTDIGRQCGQLALLLLDNPNKKIEHITLPRIEMIFDYRMLDQFNIKLSQIQKGATILHHPETLWNKHKSVLIVSILIIIQLITVIILLLRFITIQKKFKRKLLLAMKKANESDRLKSVFLANISHEFRTPLNSIVGFSDILAEMYENDDTEKKLYVEIISKNALSLNHTINHVFDFSLLESHSISLELKHFHIKDLIDGLWESNQKKVEEKELDGVYVYNEKDNKHPDISITADYNKIYQVMNNLIENAFLNTHQGQINFGYKIYSPISSPIKKDFWPDRSKPFVYFYVKDTGKGIDKDSQSIIFKPFRQVNETTIDANRSLGIGLSISKSLVDILGGKIGFESTLGAGSLFFFTLPLDYNKLKIKHSIK